MADVDNFESVYCSDKYYVYKGLTDEEVEEINESRKECMNMMTAESKMHFKNVLLRLPKLGQLI